MVLTFLAVLALFKDRLRNWVLTRPAQQAIVTAFALTAGGAYFLFYWGLARVWPILGRWGFQLGWYS